MAMHPMADQGPPYAQRRADFYTIGTALLNIEHL
jgi:hypothetical protein